MMFLMELETKSKNKRWWMYYEKDHMKIKFNSDGDLPLTKASKFYSIAIAIRSVFKEDAKLYPQVF